jgi:hypothetical protein
MFVAKIVRFILHVYFHVMSGICCTNLFACARSLTHGNWQQLFIQVTHYQPHFVKLVIIRALIVGLLVLLKCRQIWIFSNIFLRQFLTRSMPNTSFQRTNDTDSKKIRVPNTVEFIGLFGFIRLLYTFISSAFFASRSSVKKGTSTVGRQCRHSQFCSVVSYFSWIWSHPPPRTFILWWMGFCIFQMFCLHYRIPVMCL